MAMSVFWGELIGTLLLILLGDGDSDWDYSWVPIVGPLLGGAIGAFIYEQFVSILIPL